MMFLENYFYFCELKRQTCKDKMVPEALLMTLFAVKFVISQRDALLLNTKNRER